MLITEAHAQAAEATKAAAQAADVFFDRGVLGAVCVLLAITSALLLWLLIRSLNRHGELIERVVTAIEQAKNAASDNAEGLKSQQGAITALTTAVQTLEREFDGETRDNRHVLGNVAMNVRGILKRLRASPEDDDA